MYDNIYIGILSNAESSYLYLRRQWEILSYPRMQKSIQQEKNVDEDDNFCYYRYSERTVSRITTKFETERWAKLMCNLK